MSLAWSAVLCEDCSAVIPAKRLAAVPEATRCVKCQPALDDLFMASPMIGVSAEESNSADFAIFRRRRVPAANDNQ